MAESRRADRGRADRESAGRGSGGPLARVTAAAGGAAVVGRLAGLSGSDFTSLMLEVARRRAASQTPADVLRRYRTDRFVRPGETSWRRLRRAEDLLAATDWAARLITSNKERLLISGVGIDRLAMFMRD